MRVVSIGRRRFRLSADPETSTLAVVETTSFRGTPPIDTANRMMLTAATWRVLLPAIVGALPGERRGGEDGAANPALGGPQEAESCKARAEAPPEAQAAGLCAAYSAPEGVRGG